MARKEKKTKYSEETNELPVVDVEQDWLDDLQICLIYLTRIPIPGGLLISKPSIAKASRFFPLIGALIGFAGAIIVLMMNFIGFPKEPAILLGIICITAITMGMPEASLANVIDALNTQKTVNEFRPGDTFPFQIGAPGVLILIFVFVLKWLALNSLSINNAALGLFSMAVISRGYLPALMRYLYDNTNDDQSDNDSEVGFGTSTVSILIAFVICMFSLGFWLTCSIFILSAVILIGVAWILKRKFGAFATNTLGCLQQAGELTTITLIAVIGL
ncbi:MAG: adenosylcobinamide-GDP ribazoletransferase [Pseudomonadota bacterium]|nr:adenosylcobinamide-GDP ribazoletransferase [Pseudomonadota bacterium]